MTIRMRCCDMSLAFGASVCRSKASQKMERLLRHESVWHRKWMTTNNFLFGFYNPPMIWAGFLYKKLPQHNCGSIVLVMMRVFMSPLFPSLQCKIGENDEANDRGDPTVDRTRCKEQHRTAGAKDRE